MNNEIPEVTRTLFKKLKEIYDDDDFLLGMLVDLPNIEDQATVLRYIEKGEDVNDETVSLLAISLNKQRKQLNSK